MLDVHTHILPALDDGVKTLEESVVVLKKLQELGFTHIVATPHFYPGRFTPDLESIDAELAKIQNALKDESIELSLIRGRECFLDYELMTAKDRDTFPFLWKDKKYQLIELPQITLPEVISSYLQYLQGQNVIPILAHAERYNRVIRNPKEVEGMVRMGFRIQVDLMSFCSSAHKALRKTAIYLLENDLIDLLATDVHKSAHLPLIEEAMNWIHKECGPNVQERYFSLDT